MPETNHETCPLCGGDVEIYAGACNFTKKIMTLDIKCMECGTCFKFRSSFERAPYEEAVQAWGRRAARNQVAEMCPHCENEVLMDWDVEKNGYQAYCPYCGKRLMLCDECIHAGDNPAGGCDYDSGTDSCCRRQDSEQH